MEVVTTYVVYTNVRKAQDLWTANPVVHGSGLIDPPMVVGHEFFGFWQVRSGQSFARMCLFTSLWTFWRAILLWVDRNLGDYDTVSWGLWYSILEIMIQYLGDYDTVSWALWYSILEIMIQYLCWDREKVWGASMEYLKRLLVYSYYVTKLISRIVHSLGLPENSYTP